MREVIRVHFEEPEYEPIWDDQEYLSLPAPPYELLDLVERIRPERPEDMTVFPNQYCGLQCLVPQLPHEANLFSLNALAEKIAELNERELAAFRGLVQMETVRGPNHPSMQRLYDLAHSVDCCHVVDALNDSQLGGFYAENGFIPELDGLSDKVYDMLDFADIGRKMRTAEGGVFLPRSEDGPGGYVVRHSELRQAPPIPTGPPRKPDYIFRLNVSTLPLRQDAGGRRCEQLDLPASEDCIQGVAWRVGASSPGNTMAAVLDGPLTCLKEDILLGEELPAINELAERIAQLDADGMLPRFKAVQEATGCIELDQLLALAGQMDDYYFEPDKRSLTGVAMDELQVTVGGKSIDMIAKHMNLNAYGKELLERDNAQITHYGLLARVDGTPVQAPEMQTQGQCGMEMM